MVIGEHPAEMPGFEMGSLVAGYRLEAKVGEGGMAVVYRARDERLHRLVALKILAPEFATDSAFRRRFIGESEAAAAVDHPHIIPIYLAGDADGVLFISMRFVQGGDLRLLMRREGRLPPPRLAEIISPVASALDAAHAVGLVHRDVKPGNILIDTGPGRPDHVLLSDFGISKSVARSVHLTSTGQFIGTVGYSAPEQIEEFDVDGRADQYALACVTYELLTGEKLFERNSMYGVLIAHVHEQPPALTSRRPDLPPAVDSVLAKALAKVPAQRYASCGDFADALRAELALPPYHAGRAVFAPRQVQPPAEPSEPAVPGPSRTEESATPTRPEARTVTVAVTGIATHHPAAEPDTAPTPVPDEPVETRRTLPVVDALAAEAESQAVEPPEGQAVKAPVAEEPVSVVEPAPAADMAETVKPDTVEPDAVESEVVEPDVAADEPGVPVDEPHASAAVPDARAGEPWAAPAEQGIPVNGAELADAYQPAPKRDWRRRLPLVAVAAVIIGAAATIPFMLNSPAGTAHPPNSRSPSATVTSSAPAAPPKPSSIALPAAFNGSAVSSTAFSPSGTTLAIAGTLETCLWDIAARDCTVKVTGAWAVAFSPDGTTFAGSDDTSDFAAGPNGIIRLWNAATGRQVSPELIDPDSSGALSIAYRPDGKTLAVGDQNGNTYLWDIATGTKTTLPDPQGKSVNAVAFSPDGAVLAVGDASGNTYLWDVAARRYIGQLPDPGAKGGVLSIAFSPNGKTLAAGDGNGDTYLWNVAVRKLITQFSDTHSQGVRAVAFSPNGTMLAVGDHNGITYLWDISSSTRISTLSNVNDDGVTSVAFSRNGATLVTGNERGGADLWSLSGISGGD